MHHRFAPALVLVSVALAGSAWAEPAPITYAANTGTAAGNDLLGGGERAYGYGRQRPGAGPVIDLRRTSEAAEPREQGVEPWLDRERVGPPYQANGRWYAPTPEPGYAETGQASWYGPQFHGQAAANGEIFDQDALTAAHPTLPLNALVQVTNLENGREAIVRIIDRGPFVGERLIDLSRGAAAVLGFERAGGARVHVRYLGPAPRRVPADARPLTSTVEAGPLALTPPAPAPRVTPVSYTVPAGFVVQVGAFASLENAQRTRAAVAVAGPTAIDTGAGPGGGEIYRVRVGPFASREGAVAAQASLAVLGLTGAVLAAP
jgi:rare lipoprotein A